MANLNDINLIVNNESIQRISNMLYDNIDMVQYRTVDPINITPLCVKLMKMISSYTDISGKDKKHIVLQTIKRIVNETVPEANRYFIDPIIDATLPIIIDTLISVDKREIQFKLKQCCKWFSCCK